MIMASKNFSYLSFAVCFLGIAVNLWTHNYIFAAATSGMGLSFLAADWRATGRLGSQSARLLHWIGITITLTMVVISLRAQ